MNYPATKVDFIIIILLCGSIIFEANTKTVNNNGLFLNQQNDKASSKNAEKTCPQRKWISELFLEARLAFKMDPNVNTECKNDFDLYKSHLRNQSLWAVKMMESSEWPLANTLSSKLDHMGNYDDCLTISSNGIKGQYCLSEVIYGNYPAASMKNEIEDIPDEPDETISVWEALNIYQKNPGMADRKKLRFALCVPSSCKPIDLKISLKSTLGPIFKSYGLDVSADVNPIFCKTLEKFNYPRGYYIAGWSFIALFLFVICCTILDAATSDEIKKKTDGKPMYYSVSDALRSFSVARNFQNLIQIDPLDYAGLHFFKFANMLFTIFTHRLYYHSASLNDISIVEQFCFKYLILLVHASCIVDPFFMVSGFLRFHLDLPKMLDKGRFFLFSSIVLRWIRMIPVYSLLMLFIIYVLPYIGDGPMWDYATTKEATNCEESFWTSLLAINNIVKVDKMCLIIGWYVAVDIQLFIVGGILLYIFSKNEKTGIFATLISFVIFAIITFVTCYVKKFNAVLRFSPNMLKNDLRNNEFVHFYAATYPRCGPYLIGFFIAYVAKKLKEKKFRFTKIQACLLMFISILISEMAQCYGQIFYDYKKPYERFENAFYAAANRSLYVLMFAVFILLYLLSGLGILQKFVDAKIWIPLGRLTYSVFLVNTLLQLYQTASQRQLISDTPKGLNGVWLTLGDIISSYAVGLIVYVFAEAPILSLKTLFQRQLLNQRLRKSEPEPKKIITENNSNNTKTEDANCKKIQ